VIQSFFVISNDSSIESYLPFRFCFSQTNGSSINDMWMEINIFFDIGRMGTKIKVKFKKKNWVGHSAYVRPLAHIHIEG